MFDHSINDLALSINSNASVMQHSSATSVFIIGADRTLLLISGGGARPTYGRNRQKHKTGLPGHCFHAQFIFLSWVTLSGLHTSFVPLVRKQDWVWWT